MALIDNLIAYYKLDGNSNDSVASNDGTDTDVSYVAGKINQAADFNGSSSKIVLGTTGLPSGTSDRTISAWINPDNLTEFGVIFAYGTASSGAGFQWGFDSSTDKLIVGRYGANASAASSTGITTDTLQHVAVKYAHGVGLTYYLNGQPDGTASISSVNTNLTYARIGKAIPDWDAADGAYLFDGIIDELGVWDRALSDEEILELYNSGDGLSYPFSSGSSDGAINPLYLRSLR